MAHTANTLTDRTAEVAPRHIRIRPQRGWIQVDFGELWAYRELLYFLTWRDIKIRYKQTILGASWAILQPVLQMIVFSIFFGRLANISSEGYPYPIFNYAGLLPWNYFANSLGAASNSLVQNAHMITKVYFPRLLVPISSVFSGLVDFTIAFGVLLVMMVFYRESIAPTWGAILLLPLFLLLALVTALGVSLWFSTLNVAYRDVRYIIPFLVQFWLFATPVIYGTDLLEQLGEPWRSLYGLNPMVGVVEGFRWALLGKVPSTPGMIAVSVVVAIIILISGLYYFRRTERTFADVI